MSESNDGYRRNGDRAPDSTESGLLDAAKRLDPEAWNELLDRYSWLVFGWCRDEGLNADDSADVLQTVMGQVAVSLPRFEKDGKKAAFRRWLCTITRRRIVDFRRMQANQPQAQGGSSAQQRLLSVPSAAESSSDDGARFPGAGARLWRVLERVEGEVDESTWQAFWLTFVEDLTSSEAGAQLGMTATAVRLAKGRVLRRLREAATEAGDTGWRSIGGAVPGNGPQTAFPSPPTPLPGGEGR